MCRISGHLLLLLLMLVMIAQAAIAQDTLWNQTDSEGRKQGYWRKYYPDTTLMYVGFFNHGMPSGIFRRYYANGKIMAVMSHEGDDIHSFAELYYQNNVLAAKGPYYRQLKDSTWDYYSYYTGALSYRENYMRGNKEGLSYIYYPSGAIAEVQVWKNNLRTGKWIQYYEDSTLRQEYEYLNGELNGRYILYNVLGNRIIEGEYLSGNMNGTWFFYDEKGQLEYKLNYREGVNLDEEEYRQRAIEYMNKLEEDAGKIPEPDINDIMGQ